NTGDVFRRATEFHDRNSFSYQLGSHRAHKVHAQNFVGLGISQNLHKAGGVTQCASTAVSQEGEAASAVSTAFGLQLLFGLANPSDFGGGVDNPRHGVEIDVRLLTRQTLGHSHTFFFGFVSQHRTTHHVTHCPDTWQAGGAI